MTQRLFNILALAVLPVVVAYGCHCRSDAGREVGAMDRQQELLARMTAEPAGSDVAVIVTAALAEAKSAPAGRQAEIFDQAVKMADAAKAFTVPLDAPLPEGWPLPSLAGLVRIKNYPPVRAAWVRSNGSDNSQFMTLFRHIQKKEIPMTAPVVMDFPMKTDGPAGMAFLYAKTDFGPSGSFGAVTVGDDAKLTVVSVGRWGAYTAGARNKAAARLRGWLESHPEWSASGPVRVLCYHSPFHLPWNKYSEVQIPVAPVPAPAASGGR